ncbi:dipeptidase PepE [Paraferrimonas haliotis]|uniref:Peptidase E n=1 Tax=Paraferrimonas haliotis TaxID=2013866 RepID=A0AA37WWR8_9GAMM|nr:dipeptidase PepE [Paraferrimonas haliotis]GLS82669.1 peptidase E [Paraferrimonas haliotis]
MAINALMLSASRVDNTDYLEHALPYIDAMYKSCKGHWLFIPFAGVTMSYDAYLDKVQAALKPLNITISGIHQHPDPIKAIEQANGVMVGGGNTFELLNQLYRQQLIEPLKGRIEAGMGYIGWSAGSNITGLSIRTTNDMPIVEPHSFDALAILPFQLNPHYSNYHPPGHNGETRAERLQEFCSLNPETAVVGIQEGSALWRKDNQLTLVGNKQAFFFKGDVHQQTIAVDCDLSHLLAD